MQRPGEQLLACARLADQRDARLRRRDLLDLPAELGHAGIARQQAGDVLAAVVLEQAAMFVLELGEPERP